MTQNYSRYRPGGWYSSTPAAHIILCHISDHTSHALQIFALFLRADFDSFSRILFIPLSKRYDSLATVCHHPYFELCTLLLQTTCISRHGISSMLSRNTHPFNMPHVRSIAIEDVDISVLILLVVICQCGLFPFGVFWDISSQTRCTQSQSLLFVFYWMQKALANSTTFQAKPSAMSHYRCYSTQDFLIPRL